MADACRIAFEHGADSLKTYYTGSRDGFRKVTAGCPAPVLIAGGPEAASEQAVSQMVADSIAAGGHGVVFGRNIWQSPDPARMVRALRHHPRGRHGPESGRSCCARLTPWPLEPLLCGIDAGTSRIRAIVFTPDGRPVAEGRRPTPVRLLGPGSAEHDPEALWQAACGALRDAAARSGAGAVRGLAVASVGEAGVLLDRQRPAGLQTIAWYDERPKPELARLEATIGKVRCMR